MYDFVDRAVTSLDPGARFLVWATRSWVRAVAARHCPAHVLAPAFDRWNMLQALHPFMRAMAAFNRHGLGKMQFCGLHRNRVSEHEAIVIALICGLGERQAGPVRDTLALLVEEEAIGELLHALLKLAEAMDAAGITPRPACSARPC